MDKTSQWYNSFVLVPKGNGEVRLFIDQARLDKVLSTPVQRGPPVNDIRPRLGGVQYLTLIESS